MGNKKTNGIHRWSWSKLRQKSISISTAILFLSLSITPPAFAENSQAMNLMDQNYSQVIYVSEFVEKEAELQEELVSDDEQFVLRGALEVVEEGPAPIADQEAFEYWDEDTESLVYEPNDSEYAEHLSQAMVDGDEDSIWQGDLNIYIVWKVLYQVTNNQEPVEIERRMFSQTITGIVTRTGNSNDDKIYSDIHDRLDLWPSVESDINLHLEYKEDGTTLSNVSGTLTKTFKIDINEDAFENEEGSSHLDGPGGGESVSGNHVFSKFHLKDVTSSHYVLKDSEVGLYLVSSSHDLEEAYTITNILPVIDPTDTTYKNTTVTVTNSEHWTNVIRDGKLSGRRVGTKRYARSQVSPNKTTTFDKYTRYDGFTNPSYEESVTVTIKKRQDKVISKDIFASSMETIYDSEEKIVRHETYLYIYTMKVGDPQEGTFEKYTLSHRQIDYDLTGAGNDISVSNEESQRVTYWDETMTTVKERIGTESNSLNGQVTSLDWTITYDQAGSAASFTFSFNNGIQALSLSVTFVTDPQTGQLSVVLGAMNGWPMGTSEAAAYAQAVNNLPNTIYYTQTFPNIMANFAIPFEFSPAFMIFSLPDYPAN